MAYETVKLVSGLIPDSAIIFKTTHDPVNGFYVSTAVNTTM
jgi:hypothetical protein